jgi:hypothetical protein
LDLDLVVLVELFLLRSLKVSALGTIVPLLFKPKDDIAEQIAI